MGEAHGTGPRHLPGQLGSTPDLESGPDEQLIVLCLGLDEMSHPPPSGKDHAGGFKAGFVVPAPRPNWLALSGAGLWLDCLFPRWDGWWVGFSV